MNNLIELLNIFAHDPENAEHNVTLANHYYEIEQTAAAITYYLRAAERTSDTALAYFCLLRMAHCFIKQGNRHFTVRGIYKQAINLIPGRPEAYYLLSKFEEQNQNYTDAYTYAHIGHEFGKKTFLSLRANVDYPGEYGLLFEKAVAAWHWGKTEECKTLFLNLKKNYRLDEAHEKVVTGNLASMGILCFNTEDNTNGVS